MYDLDLEQDGVQWSPTARPDDADARLGLQTWSDERSAAFETRRFGRYARQIEADVLRELARVPG